MAAAGRSIVHSGGVPARRPAPGDAVPVAVSPSGRRIEVRPSLGHILISGGTGSGKSTVALSLMLHLALLDYCLVVVNPLLVGYECLDLLTDAVYSEVEEALKVLQATSDEAVARYRRMRRAGLTAHRPTAAEPRIALLVEEAPMLTATCADRRQRDAIMAALTRVANIGRKASIVLVVVTQQPSAEAIGTAVRGACATKIGLRNDHIAWQALGGGEEMLVRSQSVMLPGELLVQTPDHPGWQQGRSWLLTEDGAEEVARRIRSAGTVPCRLPPHLDFGRPPEAPEFIRYP